MDRIKFKFGVGFAVFMGNAARPQLLALKERTGIQVGFVLVGIERQYGHQKVNKKPQVYRGKVYRVFDEHLRQIVERCDLEIEGMEVSMNASDRYKLPQYQFNETKAYTALKKKGRCRIANLTVNGREGNVAHVEITAGSFIRIVKDAKIHKPENSFYEVIWAKVEGDMLTFRSNTYHDRLVRFDPERYKKDFAAGKVC